MLRCISSLIGLGLTFAVAQAQQIADFTLQDARDDKVVSLSNYLRYEAVVIVFTSNTCAFDNRYRERLFTLALEYEGRVPFLFINSFSGQEESVQAMKALHTELNFPAPYLKDGEKAVAQQLKPGKSPECFVLKNQDGKFNMVYRGAIDDNPQMAEAVQHYWLKDAIEAVLSGKAISAKEQRPVGCAIE